MLPDKFPALRRVKVVLRYRNYEIVSMCKAAIRENMPRLEARGILEVEAREILEVEAREILEVEAREK